MSMTWYLRLISLLALNLSPEILAAEAGAPAPWMLMSREGGCAGLERLARREGLSQVPTSPEEFAALLRPRYPDVSMGLPDGFPPEMAGRVVMVKWAENRAPIFVRADLCR